MLDATDFAKSMTSQWILALVGAGGAILGAIAPALAQPIPKPAIIEFRVFPALERSAPRNACPTTITVTEQPRPYREGGYTIDGIANLKYLASNFAIASSDDFSVTWVGQLNPQYRQCKATAGMVKARGDAYSGPSYLRLRFVQGKVYLILDMTGMSDANEYTTVIIRKALQNGNPTWAWGGTD
jgi:hypothetical protein